MPTKTKEMNEEKIKKSATSKDAPKKTTKSKTTTKKAATTKKTSIMLNEELWDLFKSACKLNGTTPTLQIEKYIINFVDQNNLL